ncbi:MAG: hypothetical protein A2173_06945 [Planctomycetes bacterium RBG_13_44_8b]|nr:MAG: hypothetical protein A2173_06945 [Planctomycetes bacterium RBG_13_44_8b]
MVKTLKYLAFSLNILAGGTGVVFAEEKEQVRFNISADYYNKYIWRGQNIDDDPVFQPSISAAYSNLTASIWGNLELTNINDKSGDFSELDYTLDYSAALPVIEGVGYSVGVIYYDFPSSAADGTIIPDTTEIYWGLNLDIALNPALAVYHDVDEAEGSYVSLSTGHNIEKIIEIGPEMPVGMKISASLGWGSSSYNKYYWGTNQSKLNDLAFSVSFPLKVAGWSVTSSISYITLLSDDIRDTDAYGTDSDFFVAGIGLLKNF